MTALSTIDLSHTTTDEPERVAENGELRPMQITILGKRWRILFVPAKELRDTTGKRDCDGKCDPPDMPGKAIRIYDKLGDERTLAIIVHEMLHGAGWHISEEFVEQFAEDVARAAIKAGFHRKGTDGE